jgi:hypothetical protein
MSKEYPMEITRADVTTIIAEDRARILEYFRVSPEDLLAAGTEAEVYSYGDEHVLKLYGDSGRLADLTVLKNFYESLDERPSGLTLPRIVEMRSFGSAIGVVESKVAGRPLEEFLSPLDVTAEENAISVYLHAARALKEIKLLIPPTRYILFDQTDQSSLSEQTWSEFYAKLLHEKFARIGDLLAQNVSEFRSKFERLIEPLRSDTDVEVSIIHGDFFPGNLLVADDLSHATGVVDFGSFTMFGDAMVDMAGAVGFYRMYDPERTAIRNRVLDRAESMLTSSEIGRMYRYLAGQAIVTCDLYVSESDPRDNGHFRWAIEILEDSRVGSNVG